MNLYAIRYAQDFKYGKVGHFFRNAPDSEERIKDFPFFYYLAQVEDRRYLIDTGFRDAETAEKMGVHFLPCHDATILEKFCRLSENIVQII